MNKKKSNKNNSNVSRFTIQIRSKTREIMDKMVIEENRSRSNLIDFAFMQWYELHQMRKATEKIHLNFGKEKNDNAGV